MTPTRKIITTLITITALVGCFVAFKREGESVVAKQSLESQKSLSQVKGIAETTPVKNSEYTYVTSNMITHLELTTNNIIWFTNYYRVHNGLAPLSVSSTLNRSSNDKLQDMFRYQYFEHTRPGSNRTFDIFFDQENYNFIKIGENLALGDFKTSKQVVDAWMASSEHRKNILDPLYTNIGVALSYGVIDNSPTYLFVQHFGKPRSDCPAVSSSLDIKINSLKSQITTLKDNIGIKEGNLATTSALDPSNNSIVDEYNNLINSYNLLTNQLGILINSYNKEVTRYDTCIKGK
jgi:uncharacterized protein YkwD